jgi:dephospho-CoA kinase
MLVIGLTGSIAMGKSTAARMFRRLGVPVYDADATVHKLLGRRGAGVGPVGRAFPGVVRGGAVDRQMLGRRVFGNPAALAVLERILHPLVADHRKDFLAVNARQGRPLVVLDIPLLFEVGAERLCDVVVVVTAPRFLQLQRLMLRPDMDRARIAAVMSRQMPDAEKRRRADFVLQSGLGRAATFAALRRYVHHLRNDAVRGRSKRYKCDRLTRSSTRCR